MIARREIRRLIAGLCIAVPMCGPVRGGVTGDVAALREIIAASRANRARIDTWRGRVLETRYDVDCERASTKTQCTIEFYLRVSTGQLRTLRTFGEWNQADPATLNSIVAGGKLTYRSHVGGGEGSESDVHVQPFTGPLAAAPAEYCFNPMWGFDVEGQNLAERLTRILEGSDAADWTVTRTGQTVTIHATHAGGSEQLVCDLSRAGGIIDYEAHTATADMTARWQYGNRAGIWVPSFFKRQEVGKQSVENAGSRDANRESRRLVHTLEWLGNLVNVQYPEGDFSLRCIKVGDGETIHDEIAGVSYHYTAPTGDAAASSAWAYVVLAGAALATATFLVRRAAHYSGD